MNYSLITKGMALLVVILFNSLFSLNAQEESAQPGFIGGFCDDPNACNYEDIGILDGSLEDSDSSELNYRGGIIGSSCYYGDWYIPVGDDTGLPAIQSCEPVEGYILAEQCCAINVIFNDLYCINNNWDDICQDAYDTCINGYEGCNDPAACNFNFDEFCADNSSCTYEQWFIPLEPDMGVAVLTCEGNEPANYMEVVQCCAALTVTANPDCQFSSWDDACQSQYESCLVGGFGDIISGCTDSSYCNYNPLACIDDGLCYGQSGCTYPEACNYNSNATCDDGSCIQPGCTDPQALNYDPLAQCGGFFDGPLLQAGLGGGGIPSSALCVYPEEADCPGDFNGDGSITTTDLTAFLSVFGSDCNPIIIID